MSIIKEKLTDTQLRIIQVIAGIISAAALFTAIYLPSILTKDNVLEENSLLNYVFVVVFLIIMMGRRSIENKYRLRLNLFSLTLMDGILLAVIVFASIGLYSKDFSDSLTKLSPTVKLLIIAGLSLLLLVAGIILPLVRYFKRKANGTLIPIRLPEKTEEPEAKAEPDDSFMTTEQKIAAMTRELDGDKSGSDEPVSKDDENKTQE